MNTQVTDPLAIPPAFDRRNETEVEKKERLRRLVDLDSKDRDAKVRVDAAIRSKAKAAYSKKRDAKTGKGSVIAPARKAAYGKSQSCNDEVAKALRDLVTREDLFECAQNNDIDVERYKSLNFGMQRMNVGNRLRGLIRATEPGKLACVIAGFEFKGKKEPKQPHSGPAKEAPSGTKARKSPAKRKNARK
jgi:hypothetical protein